MPELPPQHETSSMTAGIAAYPGSPAGDDAQVQASKAVDVSSWGTAALVLALIPFPVLWLVSVGFAIAALGRGHRGLPGFGRAIGALAVVVGWVALVVLLVVADGSVERGTDDQVVAAGDVAVDQLQVGDCLRDPLGTEEILTVAVVPCDDAHRGEVYAEVELPAGDYPGVDDVIRLADGACLKRFEGFVGEPYEDSPHEMTYLHPVEGSWSFDRAVTCIVETQYMVRGSVEGAAEPDEPEREPEDEDSSPV